MDCPRGLPTFFRYGAGTSGAVDQRSHPPTSGQLLHATTSIAAPHRGCRGGGVASGGRGATGGGFEVRTKEFTSGKLTFSLLVLVRLVSVALKTLLFAP